MTQRFEYGETRVKDMVVHTTVDRQGKKQVTEVLIDGRPARPTDRFWNSLHLRFGFTGNIFKYFSHDEVFRRISEVSANDRLRWCIEHGPKDTALLLAVTGPNNPVIRYDDLMTLLGKYGTEEVSYSMGYVRSKHAPRFGSGPFSLGGDKFQHKYIIDTPIDGFGRPSVYLSMLRLVCSNGAVGYSRAFRSELNVGKGDDVTFALTRVLDGFNNEDGYAAMRQRFEAATRSWASVNEAQRLYRTLGRLLNRGDLDARVRLGGDGASELPPDSPLLSAFHKMTGDLQHIYGLANLDALSVKRQRTLPAACKVYDLINFTSELATHHATPAGERILQAFLGDLISSEYDLEGTAEHFSDWKDFFVGSEATTATLANLHKRGRA